tara:strand:+ start:94 stop:327 length:234 start_codon:yes stop_codon:yes gene_type:complete
MSRKAPQNGPKRAQNTAGEHLFLKPFYDKFESGDLSREWPSEASNRHLFPLRGLALGEGCALSGAKKISIDLGGGAP